MNLTKGEKEREDFMQWSMDRDIEDSQFSIAFSLWQINNSLEKLVKATKEKQ
jgi:hypothetical protein